MNIRNGLKNRGIFQYSFDVAMILKGLNGLLEIIGGILLIFLTPDRMNNFMRFITQAELLEDPKDMVANLFLRFGREFSVSSQNFGIFYLLSHGILKVVLVTLLLRRKLWAYPISLVVFVLFVVYQIYRFTISHSAFMILLSIIDIVIIVMTYMEYKRIKAEIENSK